MEGLFLIIIFYIISKITKENKKSSNNDNLSLKTNLNSVFGKLKNTDFFLKADNQLHGDNKKLDQDNKKLDQDNKKLDVDFSDQVINTYFNEDSVESQIIQPPLSYDAQPENVNDDRRLFKNKESIRRAVIMSEVLAKPKSIKNR